MGPGKVRVVFILWSVRDCGWAGAANTLPHGMTAFQAMNSFAMVELR